MLLTTESADAEAARNSGGEAKAAAETVAALAAEVCDALASDAAAAARISEAEADAVGCTDATVGWASAGDVEEAVADTVTAVAAEAVGALGTLAEPTPLAVAETDGLDDSVGRALAVDAGGAANAVGGEDADEFGVVEDAEVAEAVTDPRAACLSSAADAVGDADAEFNSVKNPDAVAVAPVSAVGAPVTVKDARVELVALPVADALREANDETDTVADDDTVPTILCAPEAVAVASREALTDALSMGAPLAPPEADDTPPDALAVSLRTACTEADADADGVWPLLGSPLDETAAKGARLAVALEVGALLAEAAAVGTPESVPTAPAVGARLLVAVTTAASDCRAPALSLGRVERVPPPVALAQADTVAVFVAALIDVAAVVLLTLAAPLSAGESEGSGGKVERPLDPGDCVAESRGD